MDPSVTPTPTPSPAGADGAGRHTNTVVAFIIGFAIIMVASVLNAAGLNLTKLDHVRTSSIPKHARKRDWLRPLWLLGMILYVLSQLIGSTLALDYMRAEFVAPLGSASLIFNFLFARFLVGTPVTNTDIHGTIIVVIGVIGIVAFGGINSGLSSETDVQHLTALWRRGGWLFFFFCMGVALILVFIFTSSLDAVLAARSDITSEPFSGMAARKPHVPRTTILGKIKDKWTWSMLWVKEKLEAWTAPQDDKRIAWVLGIGWACCGGGLAGGCLVFAKATVKLLSGSLSHENPGNQFGHLAPIFTIILLATTAVLQIICLNRGLKVYDSTLVVPVFYGVYTATGFLDSLIFNNEVDSYKPWILFLIFMSIVILISGVVLLTSKKPERSKRASSVPLSTTPTTKLDSPMDDAREGDDGEEQALHGRSEGREAGERTLWQLGDASDDEDGPVSDGAHRHASREMGPSRDGKECHEESASLMQGGEACQHRRSDSSDATLDANGETYEGAFHDSREFGQWKDYRS
ncbi:hypothetical protein SCLCIDRAFT_1208675 [Scleroderma citrinum Foug A]|uniref:Uncharacterized protein n=1 Tax=Scleroderma citrinum Foug A TaxID=1036808 RepID=A0A0C3EN32_9AGAM|nr:hypothetical protein SCLCIDRAFT_1208675 [Scleroderma citrinum Foug A]